jgi:hypothetical protein
MPMPDGPLGRLRELQEIAKGLHRDTADHGTRTLIRQVSLEISQLSEEVVVDPAGAVRPGTADTVRALAARVHLLEHRVRRGAHEA